MTARFLPTSFLEASSILSCAEMWSLVLQVCCNVLPAKNARYDLKTSSESSGPWKKGPSFCHCTKSEVTLDFLRFSLSAWTTADLAEIWSLDRRYTRKQCHIVTEHCSGNSKPQKCQLRGQNDLIFASIWTPRSPSKFWSSFWVPGRPWTLLKFDPRFGFSRENNATKKRAWRLKLCFQFCSPKLG